MFTALTNNDFSSPHISGTEMVMPGDDTPLYINIYNDIPLELGQRFTLREGQITIGTGVVTEILD